MLTALAGPVMGRIFRGAVDGYEAAEAGGIKAIVSGGVRLTADVFLFTAATGNEDAAEAAGFGKTTTQRRPLKQVMVRGSLPKLYGHCVTATPKPVVTITAHPLGADTVWYLGGGVAEDAAELSNKEAILNARNKLTRIFPKFTWASLQWSCWRVDRAEPNAASRLPDGPALLERGATGLAWPAKLVYAPVLADLALEFVSRHTKPLRESMAGSPVPLPEAEMGRYPWETAEWQTL